MNAEARAAEGDGDAQSNGEVASGASVINGFVTRVSAGVEQLLLAIRRPEVNHRHPGVVSLPTMRIPSTIGAALARAGRVTSDRSSTFHLVHEPPTQFGEPGVGRSLTPFLVEALLCRKLAAAKPLERGEIRGLCALRMISEGLVDDPTGTTEVEQTTMYTIVVKVSAGSQLLCGDSASYSSIEWVSFGLFRQAWQQRDAQLLFPKANPFEICIRGLCVRSAVDLLDRAAHVHSPRRPPSIACPPSSREEPRHGERRQER